MKGYVYLMYDTEIQEDSIPVYIGKTKNLKQRMYQHFHERKNGKMTIEQYNSIRQIKIIELPTYADAGILERYLIGKKQPIYNTRIITDGVPSLVVNIDFSQYPTKIISKPPIKEKTNERERIPTLNFEAIMDIIRECEIIISCPQNSKDTVHDFIFCYKNQQQVRCVHVFNRIINTIITNNTANISLYDMDYIYSLIKRNNIFFIDEKIIDSNLLWDLSFLNTKDEILRYLDKHKIKLATE